MSRGARVSNLLGGRASSPPLPPWCVTDTGGGSATEDQRFGGEFGFVERRLHHAAQQPNYPKRARNVWLSALAGTTRRFDSDRARGGGVKPRRASNHIRDQTNHADSLALSMKTLLRLHPSPGRVRTLGLFPVRILVAATLR
jgi:hypothetical protein